jgi:DNA-binding protein YbaB
LVRDPGFNDLESELADARQRLDALRSRSAAGPVVKHGQAGSRREQEPSARGAGEAAGGRVRVAAADGLIESVELDPRVLRLDARELAGHLAAALNAALDDLRANAGLEYPAAGVDLGGLTRQLGAVRDQALRQLYQITSALQDAVAEMRRDASVPGMVDVPDFEGLLDDMGRTLTLIGAGYVPASPAAASQGGSDRGAASQGGSDRGAAGQGGSDRGAAGQGGSDRGAAGQGGSDRGAAGQGGSDRGAAGQGGSDRGAAGQGGSDREVRGEGTAGPGGQVRATAGQGGRVESLSMAPTVVRRGTHELAGYVVAAVNAALEDVDRQQRERGGAAAAPRAELANRVRMVQDLSLQQMRAFGDALADLMASIAPRA